MKKILLFVLVLGVFSLVKAQDSIAVPIQDSIDVITQDSLLPTVPDTIGSTPYTITNVEVEEVIIPVEPNDSVFEQDDSFVIAYPDYQPWDVVTLQGKLKMQGLPLSPSLKIFMKRDSLISISVSAPLVGEAARIVIDNDSVVAVNKMNKTYVQEGVADFLKYYPGGISDVQDLLLGRFFLPGFDVMEDDLDSLVEIFYEDNQFNVVPVGPAVIPGVDYGFVIDDQFNPLMLVILPESRPDIQIAAFYKYKLQGYDLEFDYQEGAKNYQIIMELKEPQWSGSEPKEIDLNKKFRRLSFYDFIKSI